MHGWLLVNGRLRVVGRSQRPGGVLQWIGGAPEGGKLPPATYRLVVQARDLAGNLSKRVPAAVVPLRYIRLEETRISAPGRGGGYRAGHRRPRALDRRGSSVVQQGVARRVGRLGLLNGQVPTSSLPPPAAAPPAACCSSARRDRPAGLRARRAALGDGMLQVMLDATAGLACPNKSRPIPASLPIAVAGRSTSKRSSTICDATTMSSIKEGNGEVTHRRFCKQSVHHARESVDSCFCTCPQRQTKGPKRCFLRDMWACWRVREVSTDF